MADRRISRRLDGRSRERLCDTGMPVRNGDPGNDRTATTTAASVRKQLGMKIARVQEKNGGVKGRDRSAEELDRETGEEQIQWAGHVEKMADEESGRVT